jgi:hypothetical protein
MNASSASKALVDVVAEERVVRRCGVATSVDSEASRSCAEGLPNRELRRAV